MSNQQIEVLLKIRDLATKELEKFGKESKDAGKKGKRAFDQVDKSARNTTVSIKRLAVVATGLFAAFKTFAASNRLAIEFSRAAAASEEANAKFNAVFKDGADSAEQTLDVFARTVGRSTGALKAAAAGFQDIFVPLGLARDSTQDLSIALTAMSVDVGAF